METLILQKLLRLEKLLMGNKSVFNIQELSEYTGYSRSYIYKLVGTNNIPYSKPNGKTLFFEKERIDEWLLSNSSKSNAELEQEANNYILNKK